MFDHEKLPVYGKALERQSGRQSEDKVRSYSIHPHEEIPKGFRPKAQGCEERATLGKETPNLTTPTGLRPTMKGMLCRNRYQPFTFTWSSRPKTAVLEVEWDERYVWY